MKRSVCTIVAALVLIAGQFVNLVTAQQSDDSFDLAVHLTELAETSRGICAVLGWQGEEFPTSVSQSGEFLVHAWDPDSKKVTAARTVADEADIHGRTAVIERGAIDQLPYAENTLDLILAAHLTPDSLSELSAAQLLRSLRPQGRAVVGQSSSSKTAGNKLTADQLRSWLKQADLTDVEIEQDEFGLWAKITKPALEGADDWSHWEHSPDNNPVSKDSLIKAPYMTKWLGAPYYVSMPAITTAAGGRIFNAIGHIAHHKREETWLNTLLARNGYNGTVLWSRKLPNGYLVHRSAFIASDDVFYMIDTDGSGCLMLDPETGDEKGRIDVPGMRGQWKWMAMHKGILFVLVGAKKDPAETTIVRSKLAHWSWGELSKGYYTKRVPWGFGKTLVAFDPATGKRLWIHREKKPIDSRAMVVGGDKIFAYSPDARVACLDIRTGKVIWENSDPKVREMIEQEGRGLSSTPGFRSMTFCVFTPDALIFQGQTRMNVVSISTADGYMLWNKQKTTNNPNALFLDDGVALGIGKDGGTLLVDPYSGETLDDLGFKKRSCARLTATTDSLFCRGWPEGLTRYDRNTKKVLFNGAIRPGCNDGVVAANGLLYVGPWPCDCNLMLLGRVALTSAGDFNFNHVAKDSDRLEQSSDDSRQVQPLDVIDTDWPTYRSGNARGAGTLVVTANSVNRVWEYEPTEEYRPTAAVTAAGIVFLAGDDGKIRALDAVSGRMKWTFLTAGPILHPPTIWNSRLYVGSGDGYIYALEAATGRQLWRFRASPVERRIPVYGKLSSTWPVHSGVIVEDGVAYAAAGIIDYDGTYVYALDATTGSIKWQNNTSGHLDADLRKGVSAHGDLTIAGGRLWMPGGNVVSPAAYDLETGEYRGSAVGDGSPKTNRGEEIGIFRDNHVVLGGRLRFSPVKNVVNPGSFSAQTIGSGNKLGDAVSLHQGKIPPAWDEQHVAMVDGRLSVPACYDAGDFEDYLNGGDKPKPKWIATALQGGDVVGLTVTPNAVLAVCEMPRQRRIATRWMVCALDINDGRLMFERSLPGAALPGGLTVDRDGRVIVVMADGRVASFGDEQIFQANIALLTEQAPEDPAAREAAIRLLTRTVKSPQGRKLHAMALEKLAKLGAEIDSDTRQAGGISRWQLLGPVPWNDENDIDTKFLGEPNVDVTVPITVAGRRLRWSDSITDDRYGMVDLAARYGRLANVAMYAHAEFELPEAQELLLKIGSNDGFKCWLNGEPVGQFVGPRGYRPDQDTLKVRGIAGRNRVLLKITQLGSNWAFGVRVTDRQGRPIAINYGSK